MKILFAALLLVSLCNPTYAETDTLDSNKQLVVNFYTDVLLKGNPDAIDEYIGEEYIQHNPNLPDGKEALRQLVQSFPSKDDTAPPSGKIVRVIAEGDLVVLHVNNFNWPSPNGGAIVDIFRVKDNKIVEHWDVIQAIPDTSKNSNTMF